MKNMQFTKKNGYTPYQIRLIIFLCVATFFEGYDFIALIQVLPILTKEMWLDEGSTGLMIGIINVGTILSFFIIYLADKIGRRPVLSITIIGYTLASLITGLVGNVWAFVAVQVIARIFLLGEVAVSLIYAAEVFPAERRGRVIGLLQVSATFGVIFCAGITPTLLSTELGWRAVYFVGAIPLILVAFARRNLKETPLFEEIGSKSIAHRFTIFRELIQGPYRHRIILMASIWALTYLCVQVVIVFWNLYAIQSLGLSLETVSRCVMLAALGSIPLVLGIGRLMEFGRRRAAIVVYTLLVIGAIGCYNLENITLVTISLSISIFAITGIVPILNAYTVELFPTNMRANAFALCNSLLGRIGYVASPPLVGWLAMTYGYGTAVTATIIFPVIALFLILTRLPETTGLSLEKTSQIENKEVLKETT